jgi:hypothetical protein
MTTTPRYVYTDLSGEQPRTVDMGASTAPERLKTRVWLSDVWSFPGSYEGADIDGAELIDWLAEAKAAIPAGEDASTFGVTLTGESDWDSSRTDSFGLQPFYVHTETDEEYAARLTAIEAEQARKASAAVKGAERQEKRDRETYERLRAKYEREGR